MAKNGRLATPFSLKGIYYVRRRVPKDLRPFFKGEFVMRSLETRDPAEAAHRFPAANAQVEAQFASMRQSNGTWPIDPKEQKRQFDELMNAYLGGMSETERRILDFAFHQTTPPAVDFDEQFDGWLTSDRNRIARELADEATNLARLSPLPIPIRDGLYRHVNAGLRGYMRSIHRPITIGMAGARKHRPEEPELDLTITLPTLQKLWEQKERKPSPSSVKEMTLTVRDFTDVYGNIPAAEVTRTDIHDYKRRLAKLPKRMTRAERSLPFLEREALPGSKITKETVGKKITLLKGLLSFGCNEAKLLPRNEGSGIPTGANYTGTTRDQFTPDEVSKLFELPLFRDPASWAFNRSVSDVTLAWLFLFGLTSGPRLTETGQAETLDVVTQGQIRAIQITDQPAESSNGDDVGKSVKTESSKRYIIVSPMLIKLGFNKFLAAVERAEATPLFIDLWRQGGPSTKEASRLLNRRIRQVTDRRHLCYHSLRHTWKAAARDAGINPVIERQLSGHAPRDESEKYGAAYLPILAKHAARLKFRMVDWEALAVAWEMIDWDLVVQRLISACGQPQVCRAA